MTFQFNYQGSEPQMSASSYDGLDPHVAISTEEANGRRGFVKVIAFRLNGLSTKGKQDTVRDAI